jgi:hypothetical protein
MVWRWNHLNRKIILPLIVLSLVLVVSPVFALRPPMTPPDKPEEHIWAHGELYDTIILGDIKNPNPKSLDDLYVVMYENGTEVAGQRPMTDVAPGIKGYNGGRWNVIRVSVTELGWTVHDTNNDGTFDIELSSVAQLMTHVGFGHFVIDGPVGKYFLCPLHKSK